MTLDMRTRIALTSVRSVSRVGFQLAPSRAVCDACGRALSSHAA